jgi:hypothetical protein
VTLGLSFLAVSGLAAQTSRLEPEVRIETNQAAYKTGELIEVRVTVRNATSNTIEFPNWPPAQVVSLRILDPTGRQVHSAGAPHQIHFGSSHMRSG